MTNNYHPNSVILKKGKEKPLLQRHHWIFSGAIAHRPNFDRGAILPVLSHREEMLGYAYFNSRSSIIGRMVAFGEKDPLKAIEDSLDRAFRMREKFFDLNLTNAYRLVNGEGDALPGLIIDRYADYLVIQSGTAGIDCLMPYIVSLLQKKGKWVGIYEKSKSNIRKEEGLGDQLKWWAGKAIDEIEIIENGLKWKVSFTEGQKTGFFLDQREMRHLIGSLSLNKKVLNCFSYTGGFSLYALKGGAKQVDSVDISAYAAETAEKNTILNNFSTSIHRCIPQDVFQFLRESSIDYELVILDPPAFTKKKQDIVAACRGYKEINRLALKKMPKNSMLLTCSCSYHIDPKLFQMVIFQAASEAQREVSIIGHHIQAPDHPINLFHPENDYLKSLLLYIH